MRVKDAMTRTMITISPGSGIREIYKIFCNKSVGGVPVVDKDNKLLGIVTKTELLDVLIPDYFGMVSDFLFIDDFGALEEKLESLPTLELFIAEDLMHKDVITIDEEASLMKAPALMSKFNIRRLLVVDKDKRLSGIITRMDICHALFNGKNE
ncbi:HPP family protein [Candidatus Omnitrophota bacterium]